MRIWIKAFPSWIIRSNTVRFAAKCPNVDILFSGSVKMVSCSSRLLSLTCACLWWESFFIFIIKLISLLLLYRDHCHNCDRWVWNVLQFMYKLLFLSQSWWGQRTRAAYERKAELKLAKYVRGSGDNDRHKWYKTKSHSPRIRTWGPKIVENTEYIFQCCLYFMLP